MLNKGIKVKCFCTFTQVLDLYMSISIFFYFILLLHYFSQGNIVFFTPLRSFYSF